MWEYDECSVFLGGVNEFHIEIYLKTFVVHDGESLKSMLTHHFLNVFWCLPLVTITCDRAYSDDPQRTTPDAPKAALSPMVWSRSLLNRQIINTVAKLKFNLSLIFLNWFILQSPSTKHTSLRFEVILKSFMGLFYFILWFSSYSRSLVSKYTKHLS